MISGEDHNRTVRNQRIFIRELKKHIIHIRGMPGVKPLSKKEQNSEIFGDYKLGATIVDSLTTLYIMNMSTEFERTRDWVHNNLDLSSVDSEMSVFETVIRFVGGLLSAFAFTNNKMFLQKAQHVSDPMLPVFKTPIFDSLVVSTT